MAVDKKAITERFEQLKNSRSSWDSLWRDIRDYVLPDSGNFAGENAWEGNKRYGKIIDAEATHCADIIAAGLLTGVSSPSRPWLRLTTMDDDLDDSQEVKEWLDTVAERMLSIMAKAEVYNQLHQSYLELPVFGTSCTLVRPHPTNIISLENLTVGEFYLADDGYGRVDTLYRTFKMTTKQMVRTFGYQAVSDNVRNEFDKGLMFSMHEVVNAIEPRWDREPFKTDNKNKPWMSVYFDPTDNSGKVLLESGFDDFPALCPRWFTNAHAVYGRGPGAKVLSATKRLQQHSYAFDVATDYATNPPILYPSGQPNVANQMKPGGRVPVSSVVDAQTIKSAWDVKTDPSFLQAQILADKEQIRRFFHADTFQMITQTSGKDRTATEVAALEQEKIMMLGPVLTRLHLEMLDPLVDNLFAFMVERNLVPEIPDALAGKDLTVEYISVLAKQQKAAASEGVGRFMMSIGALMNLDPEARDKVDIDRAIDHIADFEGVPADMVVTGDQVALVRKTRAERQMQADQMQAAQQNAETLRTLGEATSTKAGQEMLQAEQRQQQQQAMP